MSAEASPSVIDGGNKKRGDRFYRLMEEHVSEIERSVGVCFPGALRRLLLEHDTRAVCLMFGGQLSAQRLLQLRERLSAGWAASSPSPKLLGDFVVFASGEDDELLFLIASEGDDPPVYEWFEGNDRATRRWPSFSACARELLAEHPFVGCI